MPSRSETRLCHARYFSQQLQRLEDRFRNDTRSTDTVVQELSDTWSQINAAQSWANANVSTNDEAARVTSVFAGAGNIPGIGKSLLDTRRPPRERAHWFECGVRAARRLGNAQAAVVHLYDLGVALLQLSDQPRGIACLTEALAAFRGQNDRYSEGVVLNALGFAYQHKNDFEEAIRCFEQALKLFRDSAQDVDEAFTLMSLASVLRRSQRIDPAKICLLRASELLRKLGDLPGEVSIQYEFGLIHQFQDQPEQAMHSFGHALASFDRLTTPSQRDRCSAQIIGIALAFASQQSPASERILSPMVDEFRKVGNRLAESFAVLALGYCALMKNDLEVASTLLQRSSSMFRHLGNRQGEGFAAFYLGAHAERKVSPSAAMNSYQIAAHIFKEVGYENGVRDAQARISNLQIELSTGERTR